MKKNLHQLTLNLCLKDAASFDNFLVGNNQHLINILKNWYLEPTTSFVYIWGPPGSGKTHLLEAVCRLFHEQQLASVYLPLEDMANLNVDILDSLETINLLCCDNLDAIADNYVWEEGFFHCFNRCMIQNKKIIVTANVAPQFLLLKLPDLKSRMSGGLVFALQTLNDEEKVLALKLRAQARGLELTDGVARFLVHRYERNTKNLLAVLQRLDEAALIAQRKLTIPFIKDILGISKED